MCFLQLTTVEGVEVDISLGSDDGVKAAEIIKAKLKEYPEAKALTIVLKAFLKARRLNDVSLGGLGGYSLVNMVIAHLQEEKKVHMHPSQSLPSCEAVILNSVAQLVCLYSVARDGVAALRTLGLADSVMISAGFNSI